MNLNWQLLKAPCNYMLRCWRHLLFSYLKINFDGKILLSLKTLEQHSTRAHSGLLVGHSFKPGKRADKHLARAVPFHVLRLTDKQLVQGVEATGRSLLRSALQSLAPTKNNLMSFRFLLPPPMPALNLLLHMKNAVQLFSTSSTCTGEHQHWSTSPNFLLASSQHSDAEGAAASSTRILITIKDFQARQRENTPMGASLGSNSFTTTCLQVFLVASFKA